MMKWLWGIIILSVVGISYSKRSSSLQIKTVKPVSKLEDEEIVPHNPVQEVIKKHRIHFKGDSGPHLIEQTEFSKDWESELYEHLMILDQMNADRIYHEYRVERQKYENEINGELASNFRELSSLNGESFPEGEARSMKDLSVLEREHQTKVRKILGEHYDYLSEQHRQFQDLNQWTDDR